MYKQPSCSYRFPIIGRSIFSTGRSLKGKNKVKDKRRRRKEIRNREKESDRRYATRTFVVSRLFASGNNSGCSFSFPLSLLLSLCIVSIWKSKFCSCNILIFRLSAYEDSEELGGKEFSSLIVASLRYKSPRSKFILILSATMCHA